MGLVSLFPSKHIVVGQQCKKRPSVKISVTESLPVPRVRHGLVYSAASNRQLVSEAGESSLRLAAVL